ncbi:hypothetical protein DY000_02056340 [Brassica cretica]|uniref:Carbohydrate kinase FGGY C-terminal domain-containing protein n=1 Tax=Brassica cretica TaxID=69181 RepID=A0ABQ7AEV9_BRACR|nr:hypothetical protein DY000_02056340 [Brassica cretica]
MLGQACKKGEAKSTYDTGPFILLNTGEVPTKSGHGLLTTLSYYLGPQAQTNYALEGSIVIAGAAVQWLRDSLGIIKSASEIEDLAAMVETTGGVYFVPAFNGLFAPWWREDARGVCIGITRFTNKSHIARAELESMCFQVKDVLDSLNNEKGEFLLRVDGGATANNLLMHIQADLMGTPVVRPVDIETTALGAARLEKELSGGRSHFVESCGLPISTYFSAMKLLWLMENVDAVKDAIKKGYAIFGTIDTWLIWNMTGGVNGGLHVTDVTNASRTMLMNLKTLSCDEDTLKTLGIPAEILPRL